MFPLVSVTSLWLFYSYNHQLQLVQSPAPSLRLYLTCFRHQVPSPLFADSYLPASTLSLTTGARSLFIFGIEHIARQFLSDLTPSPSLPDHSWSLATLPVRSGGLGFIALLLLYLMIAGCSLLFRSEAAAWVSSCHLTLPFSLSSASRTIKYSITGIPLLDFARHAAPRPPNAPPPDPSH
jgi:hypothetical protein